jgi:hypothetical protein
VIDGATNSTLPVAVGDGPSGLAVNSTTNTVYVANGVDGTVSVIGGNTKLQLVNVTPCRLVDTRQATGEFGGPAIQGRHFAQLPHPAKYQLQYSQRRGLFPERHCGANYYLGLLDHLALGRRYSP